MKFERGLDPREALKIGRRIEITWGQRLHRNSLYKLSSSEIHNFLRQLSEGNNNTIRMNLTFYDSEGLWYAPEHLVGNVIYFNHLGKGMHKFVINESKFRKG